MKTTFKLAMVQMRVTGGEKQENLDRAEKRIGEAAARGAEVIVLPEAMNLGWTHSSAREEADAIPGGESCERLKAAAQRHHVYVCAGLVEAGDGKLFNAAVLISPQGEVLRRHRKINELEIAHDLYSLGESLQVVRTPLGVFGVMICADAFADGQVISRALGMMGAQVIVSPCAWAVPADHDNAKEPYGQLWRDNYCPVARNFRLWIAGVSNVGWLTDGPWKGRKCIGCSLLVNPGGEPVLQGPYGENAKTILYADIETTPR